MGKQTVPGGGSGDKYLGFNIPPNSLMASSENGLDIWSAPATDENIGFIRKEERGNQVIHRMAITVPLTPEHAELFRKNMKRKGKDKFTKENFMEYIITYLEFACKEIMDLGMAPEYARDTTALRLEEMKKGPITIHFN